jgi:hypothetical protein
MKFTTTSGIEFDIADDWWNFAEMNNFSRGERTGYAYNGSAEIQEISVAEIEPPARKPGVEPFNKCRMVPILLAIRCCVALPPVEIQPLNNSSLPYRFGVYDGFHRYYASVAVGFTDLPVIVRNPPCNPSK